MIVLADEEDEPVMKVRSWKYYTVGPGTWDGRNLTPTLEEALATGRGGGS